jgi:hypothetical protein
MELDDIEIGKKYRCDYNSSQYFATLISKEDNDVCLTLGDIVNKDGDPGNPTEVLGTLGKIGSLPSIFIPFERDRSGIRMLLTAYLDESGTHETSPVSVMAGYLGTADQWRAFDWTAILQAAGPRYVHAVDLFKRTKQFKEWPAAGERLCHATGWRDRSPHAVGLLGHHSRRRLPKDLRRGAEASAISA